MAAAAAGRPAVTLRARLFVLVSVAVIVAVVLVALTVSVSARRSFVEIDAQRTAAVVAQVRRALAAERDRVVGALDRIAGSERLEPVRAALARGDREDAVYLEEAAQLAGAHGLAILDLVADDGTILSSAHWAEQFGRRHPWGIDPPPLPGTPHTFVQTIERPGGSALGMVAVVSTAAGVRRLYLAGGDFVGQQFLRMLAPPGVDLLIYDVRSAGTGHLIAATHVPPDAGFGSFASRVGPSSSERTGTIESDGTEATVHAMPLAGRDGRTQAVLLVVMPAGELAALMRRIRWSAIGFGALGIALGFVLSYAVARRVTQPVEHLADAARRIADGDWEAPVQPVRTSREIAALADAFDTMTHQLVDQRERLLQAERVAAWREVARRLAHELKNPLFPLRITLDNLRRAKPLPASEFDEVFEESIGTLSSGIGNLNTVIGRFGDFARMPPPVFATVAPNAIVEAVAALVRPQCDAHAGGRIALQLALDPEAGTIRADGEQLGRMLQNLLLNAIDAMPSGGVVAVRTRRAERRFHLDVSDGGHGIDPGERARLFTPYYTTKQHGTGLGLAIVQSVVTDHRGKISVDSAPGRGSTFHIELPV